MSIINAGNIKWYHLRWNLQVRKLFNTKGQILAYPSSSKGENTGVFSFLISVLLKNMVSNIHTQDLISTQFLFPALVNIQSSKCILGKYCHMLCTSFLNALCEAII